MSSGTSIRFSAVPAGDRRPYWPSDKMDRYHPKPNQCCGDVPVVRRKRATASARSRCNRYTTLCGKAFPPFVAAQVLGTLAGKVVDACKGLVGGTNMLNLKQIWQHGEGLVKAREEKPAVPWLAAIRMMNGGSLKCPPGAVQILMITHGSLRLQVITGPKRRAPRLLYR
ncbi:hypothetical protein CDAR_595471 [Caerostris darwini]|uniref:Uncharacterized protein n=1 Tax=Caerostris darwini TaxID=1538125 RepID=A0AAV4SJT6_9ARAC|nr:hypothetical protein CDAR_595471 [Caerostris darwini]